MGFRMQDLMTDLVPGRGLELANDRCTCAASANPGGLREQDTAPGRPGGRPDGAGVPIDNPACQNSVLPTRECPSEEMSALAANLVALKAQLGEHVRNGPV
jgi:hypothetical protein